MGFGILSAIGAGTSLLGGILGGHEANDAEREQRGYINQGLGEFDNALGALGDAEGLALQDIDAANLLLAGVEDDVLAALDEPLRVRIGQQVLQDQADHEALQARLATAGLDSSTAGAGIQRGQRLAQAQSIGSLSASFGGARANAIASARGAQAGGLFNRAQTLASFGSQRAGIHQNKASFLGSIGVQPSNIGASIGQLGGSLTSLGLNSALLDTLSNGGKPSYPGGLPWDRVFGGGS